MTLETTWDIIIFQNLEAKHQVEVYNFSRVKNK